MKYKKIIGTALIIVLILTGCTDKKAKVLIIGDSISLGYTPFVKEKLSGKIIVFHNPGNAQHTGTGLDSIRAWVGNNDWNIIQFNWGFWDLCYRNPDSKIQGNRDKINGKITFSVEDYKANLDSIVTILKTIADAKLIFVTTTYVPENEAGRFNADVLKYNDAAKEVMIKHSVAINDIYEKSIDIHKQYGLGSDNVHYTGKGYMELSKLIVSYLEKEVETMKTKISAH